MAYIITRSDGVTTHTVEDGDVDGTYSSPLVGREYTNFGTVRAQDTLRTLENFAHTIPPEGAIPGQLWFDTGAVSLKYYNGPEPSLDVNSSTDLASWSSVSGIAADGIDVNLIPKTGYTIDLGTAANRFHQLFATHGNFSSSGHSALDILPALTVSGDSVYGAGTSLTPEIDASPTLGTDLGLDSKRWKSTFTRDLSVSNHLTLVSAGNKVTLSCDPSLPDTIIPVPGFAGNVGLGNNTFKFDLYAGDISTESLVVQSTSAGDGLASNLIPVTDEQYNLGSVSKKYNQVHSREFFEDGVSLDIKYGTVASISLNELSDVELTVPSDGQILEYNNVLNKWVNTANEGSGPHSSLSGLGADDHPQYLTEARGDGFYLRNSGHQVISGGGSLTASTVKASHFRAEGTSGSIGFHDTANGTNNNDHFTIYAVNNTLNFRSVDDNWSSNGSLYMRAYHGAGVRLYYNNVGRLLTTSDGIELGGNTYHNVITKGRATFEHTNNSNVYGSGTINKGGSQTTFKGWNSAKGEFHFGSVFAPFNVDDVTIRSIPNATYSSRVIFSVAPGGPGSTKYREIVVTAGGLTLPYTDAGGATTSIVWGSLFSTGASIRPIDSGAVSDFKISSVKKDSNNKVTLVTKTTGTGNNTGVHVVAWLDANAQKWFLPANGSGVGSDKRIKKNITPIENAIDKLLQIRGVTYDSIDTDQRRLGVIGQEVHAVFPEAVFIGEHTFTNGAGKEETVSDFHFVDYPNLVPALIEAAKESHNTIESLKNEVAELKALVNKLIG